MACCGGPTIVSELQALACQTPCIVNEMQDIVGQIGCGSCGCDPGGCCVPCAPPCCAAPCMCNFPFAQVTMTVPPPICAPTTPQPVKPLMLRCPAPPSNEMSPEERELRRIDNFYNNYNIDWHDKPEGVGPQTCDNYQPKQCGVTVDGKSPCNTCPKKFTGPLPGCPTGFKPCTMRLRPPPCCHPLLPWCAEVLPCPAKDQMKKKKKKCGKC